MSVGSIAAVVSTAMCVPVALTAKSVRDSGDADANTISGVCASTGAAHAQSRQTTPTMRVVTHVFDIDTSPGGSVYHGDCSLGKH